MSCPEKDFDLVVVGTCGNAELVPRRESNDIESPRIPLLTVSSEIPLKRCLETDFGTDFAK